MSGSMGSGVRSRARRQVDETGEEELQPLKGQPDDFERGAQFPAAREMELAFNYVRAAFRRAPKGILIGIATVGLVVGFAAMLQSVVVRSPLVFMRLSEDQVGDVDMILTPDGTGTSGMPLLNQTEVAELLRDNDLVQGTSARWLLLGRVSHPSKPLVNTSAWIIVVDSQTEDDAGMGRNWNRRPLGEQEVYASETVLLDLGVEANKGERIKLTIDVLSLLASLGGDLSTFGAQSNGDDIEVTKASLEALTGLDLSGEFEIDLDNTVQQLLAATAPDTPIILPDGTLGTVPVDVGVLLDAALPAVRDALVIEQELIVIDSVNKPGGKYTPQLGNAIVIEMSYAAQLLRETLDASLVAIEALQLDALTSALNGIPGLEGLVGTVVPTDSVDGLSGFLASSRIFVDSIDVNTLRQYTPLVYIQYSQRDESYQLDGDGLKVKMIEFTDSVFESLGDSFPASPSLPLTDSLAGSIFIRLFLDQIFNSVIFLLGLLGVMVIYSLVLGDVEEKTYEYGMLRALGMKHGLLGRILGVQSSSFAIPGMLLGFLVASILTIIIMIALAWVLVIDVSEVTLGMSTGSIIYGICLGSIMPALANIVPIRRALSKTLRDSLDVYHQSFSDISVTVTRLADIGLSPAQLVLSIMLVVIGFVTYTLLPLAFVLENFGLFLGILNSILLGMLLGLSLVAQSLQATMENLILWCMLWGREQRMSTVVSKNLAGHRTRNRKTAYMISISVAFLLFGGTMFALQAMSIQNTVELFVGADILVWSLTPNIVLPQEEMTGFLESVTNPVPGRDKLVDGYTYMTFAMDETGVVDRTRFSNLADQPDPQGFVFGVQSNFEQVTFNKFVTVTELVDVPADASWSSQLSQDVKKWPVAAMYAGATELTLPVEADGRSAPVTSLTGPFEYPYFVCNVSDIDGITQDMMWDASGGTAGTGGLSPAAMALASTAAAEGRTPSYGNYDVCSQRCQPGRCIEMMVLNNTFVQQTVDDAYKNYVDIIMSEAARGYSSADTTTPLKLRVIARDGVTGSSRSSVYLAKARAMVSKMPGFFFSSYSQTGADAPIIVRMQSFTEMVLQAETDAELAAEASSVGGDDGVTGAPDSDAPVVIAPTPPPLNSSEHVWIASSPTWTQTGPSNDIVGGGSWVSVDGDVDAKSALDADTATYAEFPTTENSWFVFDLGRCTSISGIRIFGSNTVGDVRRWRLGASPEPSGPFQTIVSGSAGTADVGLRELWHEFSFGAFSSQYWQFEALDNYGWTSGTVIVDLQFKMAVTDSCDADRAVINEEASIIPKQRLFVKLVEDISDTDRQRVLNGLRNSVTSDLMRVDDAKAFVESTEIASLGLQVFFNVVAALCLILCFFASWMSFSANIRENSTEFGILRALGFSVAETLRVYIYESLSVVLSSFLQGTVIGLVIAISLTLQFNLFTEMPFELVFPTVLFVFMFVMCCIVAVLSSYYPAKELSRVQVSDVVKGKKTVTAQ